MIELSLQDLIDLKILLAVALCLLFSPYIAKFLRIDSTATEIMLGAALFAIGIIDESPNFELVAKLGFYYLMFMAGMEVDLRSFFTMQRHFARHALLYIALLYAFSSIATSILGLSAIFIIILPVMSVGLLSLLFKDFGRGEQWLNTAMLVATLAEVVSITLLTILAAFLGKGNALAVTQSLLYLGGFLCLCLLGFRVLKVLFFKYPWLKHTLAPRQDRDERDIRFCMGVFALIIAAMLAARLEVALGAFIAGSFIATFFDHRQDLRHKLGGFGFGFLIPIFFVYIGSTFDLKALCDLQVLKNAFCLFLGMMALRMLCAGVFVRDFGLKNTLLFGLSHSMPLTLLIATATLFRDTKFIQEPMYQAFILTALLEAIVVLSFVRFLAKRMKRKSLGKS